MENTTLPVDYEKLRYLHLTLSLPSEMRGKELSAADMARYGASLEAYEAIKL